MATNLLSRSAQGASLLILLQVSSRALTFVLNQTLLRYLSPQIFGVATQLELFSISTLYFSRESIRVALQRQRGDGEAASESTKVTRAKEHAESKRIQNAVSMAYLAVGLGVALTLVFRYLYMGRADAAVLSTPYIRESLDIYAVATIVEILNEPLFAIAQQQMLYGTRAFAEMAATVSRCLVTCGTAIWAARSGQYPLGPGVLPFALGQLTYSVILIASYIWHLAPIVNRISISLLPRLPERTSGKPDSAQPDFTLAIILYVQSLFKQLLTSGDAYLIALFTPLSSQGSYALASNYGSLFARVLFQPIEESSRGLLARLLPPQSTAQGVRQAKTYLTTVFHFYSILSLVLVTLGPPLTAPLLLFVAGPEWARSSSAAATAGPSTRALADAPGTVLAAYCFYLPTLAFNGVLDAYFASMATPAQLRVQSMWMVVFSSAFAVLGYMVLQVLDWGAVGLVGVNGLLMFGRIWLSGGFMQGDLARRQEESEKKIKAVGQGLDLVALLPSALSVAAAVVGRGVMEQMMRTGVVAADVQAQQDKTVLVADLAKLGGVVAATGCVIAWSEREFLMGLYGMFIRRHEQASAVQHTNGKAKTR